MSISDLTMSEDEGMEVRHPMARPRLQTVVEGESRTHQSFHDSTRISSIYERFTRTGSLGDEDRKARAQFGDVSNLNKPLTDLMVEAEVTRERVADYNASVKAKADQAAKEAAAAPGGGSAQEPGKAPVAPPPATPPSSAGGQGS